MESDPSIPLKRVILRRKNPLKKVEPTPVKEEVKQEYQMSD
jgi:hypothetical protein